MDSPSSLAEEVNNMLKAAGFQLRRDTATWVAPPSSVSGARRSIPHYLVCSYISARVYFNTLSFPLLMKWWNLVLWFLLPWRTDEATYAYCVWTFEKKMRAETAAWTRKCTEDDIAKYLETSAEHD